jgi:ADP-ribosyl-[dinitrogen reductase] hydrolase
MSLKERRMHRVAQRTSLTHPLQIAEIPVGPQMGKIGITFCPGKHQESASTGAWQRDLGMDLDAIAGWGAVAVVTLIEDQEFASLRVRGLGDAVADRHMSWFHLPIADVNPPGPAFERAWAEQGGGIRFLLRNGFNVLVHCKGGLGRAGTIAARLLVELGWAPESAIGAVRQARPGAIETAAQEHHVLFLSPIEERQPDTGRAATEDRFLGALVGLAVGDAVGTTLEFHNRDSVPRLTDMVGRGPFNLAPGQWTDDTAMALALAASLAGRGDLDEEDLMRRFVAWWREGEYSCTGTCFDIGVTTSAALTRFERTGNPIAGSTSPDSAGNGSLMRLAPIVLHGHGRGESAGGSRAARQSATTHGAWACLDACERFASLLHLAATGSDLASVFGEHGGCGDEDVARVMNGSWRGKHRDEIQSTGYVIHTLEAAIWCVARTTSFRDAVLLAANLGHDADTTAAVTGQLAGAVYGLSAIPSDWLDKLAWRERIEAAGRELLRGGK